jgi:hypothetical protein
MEPALQKRIREIVERTLLDMRQKWWFTVIVLVANVTYWVFQDWVVGSVKGIYAAHVKPHLAIPVASFFPASSWHPIVVMVGSFLVLVLGFFVHAYFETRTTAGAITGAADLLVTRMDMGDAIHVDAN